jgi:hypothetical protein
VRRDAAERGEAVMISLHASTIALCAPYRGGPGRCSRSRTRPSGRVRLDDLRGTGRPETGKFRTARCVDAPYRTFAGTVISPIVSFSTKLAKWTLEGREGGYQGKQMHLEVRMQGIAYNLKFNEAEAMKLPWPSVWPPEAMEATKPEAFITHEVNGQEYQPSEIQVIKDLVATWTNGKPESQPPVVTAKWISKQVGDMVQVSGSGFGYSRTGKIQGIDPMGAPRVAVSRRGSQFDMTCLLIACLREAGIPTRLVVGYDVASDKEERIFLEVRRTRSEDIRTWAEFALYDEKNDILTWVPIDIVAQRAQSSRLPDIAKPWDYFGNHKELQGVIPFAFQFQPPTTVRAYGTPGFWGWLVLPMAPERAEQWLTLHANSPSKRGGAPKAPRERD